MKDLLLPGLGEQAGVVGGQVDPADGHFLTALHEVIVDHNVLHVLLYAVKSGLCAHLVGTPHMYTGEETYGDHHHWFYHND